MDDQAKQNALKTELAVNSEVEVEEVEEVK